MPTANAAFGASAWSSKEVRRRATGRTRGGQHQSYASAVFARQSNLHSFWQAFRGRVVDVAADREPLLDAVDELRHREDAGVRLTLCKAEVKQPGMSERCHLRPACAMP
eukprot:6187141-Pleurochrysis_carterae.AAC.2